MNFRARRALRKQINVFTLDEYQKMNTQIEELAKTVAGEFQVFDFQIMRHTLESDMPGVAIIQVNRVFKEVKSHEGRDVRSVGIAGNDFSVALLERLMEIRALAPERLTKG